MSLSLYPMQIADAKAHVARWHRHSAPPVGGICAACVVDPNGWPVGVAVIGRPVSRVLQERGYLEVTRVATTGARNACSMLYGWAAREALRRQAPALCTYTRADEPGTSLRAAGWIDCATTRPRSRGWANRGGRVQQERIGKIRWEPRWSLGANKVNS
jgi:hypothetical protein